MPRRGSVPQPEPPARRVEALRREIRRAGAETAVIRTTIECARPLGCLVAPLGVVVLMSLSPFVHMPLQVLNGIVGVAILLALVSKFARPVAAAFRRIREEQLRRKLARLPREELAEVLLPLRHYAFDETRRLVEPLIEHLRPEGTELAPASTPEGTGSEPTAPR